MHIGLAIALITGSAYLQMPPQEQQAYLRATLDASVVYDASLAPCVGPLMSSDSISDMARAHPDEPVARLVRDALKYGCRSPLMGKLRIVGPSE